MKLDDDYLPLVGVPGLDLAQLPQIRARMAAMSAANPPRRSNTVEWQDVTVQHSAHSVRVRLYLPGGGKQRGALVYLHGGGFVVGDLNSEHERLLDYAEQAHCVVVSVDYRLAPEHPFPAAHMDGWAVLNWLQDHVAALNVDPERIALGGGSAGGALALGLALRARDERGPAICLLFLVQPVVDHLGSLPSARAFDSAPFLGRYDPEVAWKCYFGGEAPGGQLLSYAAPLSAESLAGLPATFMLVANVDPTRDEALAVAHRMIEEGTEVELHLIPGVPHGFDVIHRAAATRRLTQIRIWALQRTLSPLE